MAPCILILICLTLFQFIKATPTPNPARFKDFDTVATYNTKNLRQFRKSEITWRIDKFSSRYSLTNDQLTQVIRNAMEVWSEKIPLQFHQVTNNQTDVDISIRFLDSSFDEWAYSIYQTMAQTFFNSKPVRIHFNGEVLWVIGNGNTTHKDIYTAALHQIGHALGLRIHSNSSDSLLFKEYTGRHSALSPDVVRDIQALYGNKTHPISSLAVGAGFCTAGDMYCGQQLQSLGYQVPPGFINDLFRCDNDGDGIFYRGCSSCTSTTALGAFCQCRSGKRYCGYDVRQQFINKPTDYQAVYECKSPAQGQFQLIENCSGSCYEAVAGIRCADRFEERCYAGKLHCGYDLVRNGIVRSPGANWEFNALYNCSDTTTAVKKCSGICSDTWGGAQCSQLSAKKAE